MITLLDGPAGGTTLNCKRAALMVFVVIDGNGKVDALDQPNDEIRPGERAYVYRCVKGSHSAAFVDGVRDGKRFGERRESASYKLLPNQPGPEHLVSRTAFAAWCDANKAELYRGYEAGE